MATASFHVLGTPASPPSLTPTTAIIILSGICQVLFLFTIRKIKVNEWEQELKELKIYELALERAVEKHRPRNSEKIGHKVDLTKVELLRYLGRLLKWDLKIFCSTK